MLARQRTGGPLVGNFSTMPDSRQTESRLGPSHCGQSSANRALPARNQAQNAPRRKLQIRCMATHYMNLGVFALNFLPLKTFPRSSAGYSKDQ